MKGTGIESTVPGVIASAHVRPGNSVVWIVNTNRDDKTAAIRIDAQKIGLDPAREIQAYDAEDGTRYSITSGLLTVPVPRRMWRAVRLSQPRLLARDIAFVADFEHEVAATEAWGDRYPLGGSLPLPVENGRVGKGAPIAAPLIFAARHHISGGHGTISLDLRLTDSTDGAVVTVEGLELSIHSGALALRGATLTGHGAACPTVADHAWHGLTLTWSARDVQVSCDGVVTLTGRLNTPLQLPGMGRGLEIRDERTRTEPATVKFGPLHATIDNLSMGASAPSVTRDSSGGTPEHRRRSASL